MGLTALLACGQPPSAPARPVVAAPAVGQPRETPPDVTLVPEPAGLVLVARVAKAESMLATLKAWSKLPLPGGAELVRSITDESVASAVDLSQPVDGAIALAAGSGTPKPLLAVAVAVTSFEDAKAKLQTTHTLTDEKNGALHVEGIGRGAHGDDHDASAWCVLAHAYGGARLVCGEPEAVDVLASYLTRTLPRKSWPSDLHVELMPGAVREPLLQFRQALPAMARSMLGSSSPSLAQLVDAGVNELVDFVRDAARLTLDAQLGGDGLETTLKLEFQTAQSTIAKIATSDASTADVPPQTFWHLPAESDLAGFGRGVAPELLVHPKELLRNALAETTQTMGMPEDVRTPLRELLVDRTLGLFTGRLVYAKGHDAAAVDRAFVNAHKAGVEDANGVAGRALVEQVLGWQLVQVDEPVTNVGSILRDWAQLWGRPSFAAWAKSRGYGKTLATLRIAPPPGSKNVRLPNETVHLAVRLASSDRDLSSSFPVHPGSAQPKARPAKRVRAPLVIHVLAVPDQGRTWLAVGLDPSLLAEKALGALSTASHAGTLRFAPYADELRDVQATGAMLATLRGLLVFTALHPNSRDGVARSAYGTRGDLPSKGANPVVVATRAERPSEASPGGSAVARLKVSRAAIEDIVKVVMTR